MTKRDRLRDIELVDEFLADMKTFSGNPPEFGPKSQKGGKFHMWEAVWPIANSFGITETGQLRTNYYPASEARFSLNIIFRGNCIYRIDFESESKSHSNPLWARALGVPSKVFGPHVHTWSSNRAYLETSGIWDLPCGVPLLPSIRNFDEAFEWLANEVNVNLGVNDRKFTVPEGLML